LLKANHQAGQVVIEITDDGRGLNRAKIIEKAVQKGLIASPDGLADNEIYNLIFQPGFSTAAQVTNVSGRGVGMDVVRRHIEKLRGRVEIRSALGQGATFLLKTAAHAGHYRRARGGCRAGALYSASVRSS
jgi:two-component system chemotaxis sensor kinase CheA